MILFLFFGVVASVFYTVSTYIFTDESIVLMLRATKPGIQTFLDALRKNVPLVSANRAGLIVLVVLFVTSLMVLFTKQKIGKKTVILSLTIPTVLAFAYPIVSRDIFSYLYYAKMILVNQQNPYLVVPASNWGSDMWVGFLHNIERTYAYGPVALLINLLPMAVLGGSRLMVNFVAYKVICLFFYFFGGWLLVKIMRDIKIPLVLWILNPFVLNELLINGHNDLFMIVFFWLAIYFRQKAKNRFAIFAYLLSVGTKFMTVILLPILFLPKKWQNLLTLASIIVIGSYLIYNGNLLWYFSWIYFCLPYLKPSKPQIISILFLHFSLTMVYAGFLESGLWGPLSSSKIISSIAYMRKYFVPLFVVATVYPFFVRLFSFRRSS